MSSDFVTQAGLELTVFLPQLSRCWDYRSVPVNPTQIQFLNFLFLFVCVYVVSVCAFTCGVTVWDWDVLIDFCTPRTPHFFSPLRQGLSLNLARASHFGRVAG